MGKKITSDEFSDLNTIILLRWYLVQRCQRCTKPSNTTSYNVASYNGASYIVHKIRSTRYLPRIMFTNLGSYNVASYNVASYNVASYNVALYNVVNIRSTRPSSYNVHPRCTNLLRTMLKTSVVRGWPRTML